MRRPRRTSMLVPPASVSVSCCTTQRLQECADADQLEAVIACGRALVGEMLARVVITGAVLRTAIVPLRSQRYPRPNRRRLLSAAHLKLTLSAAM